MKNYAKIKYSPFLGKYVVKFVTLLDSGIEIENPRIIFDTKKGDTIDEIKTGLFRAGFGDNDVIVL